MDTVDTGGTTPRDTGVEPECSKNADCVEGTSPLQCEHLVCDDGRCVTRNVTNDNECDDQNRCTDNDRCSDGACVGSDVVCPTGGCVVAAACDVERGCITTEAQPNGTPCGDPMPAPTCDPETGGFIAPSVCLDTVCQARGSSPPDPAAAQQVHGTWFMVRTTLSADGQDPRTQSGYLDFEPGTPFQGMATDLRDTAGLTTDSMPFSYCVDPAGQLAIVTGEQVTLAQLNGDVFIGWRVEADATALTLAIRPHSVQGLQLRAGAYHAATISIGTEGMLRTQLGAASITIVQQKPQLQVTFDFQGGDRAVTGEVDVTEGTGGVTTRLADAQGDAIANPVWTGVVSKDKRMILLQPSSDNGTARFGMMVLADSGADVNADPATWRFASFQAADADVTALKGAHGTFETTPASTLSGTQVDDQGADSTLSGAFSLQSQHGSLSLQLEDSRPFTAQFIGFGGVPAGFAIGVLGMADPGGNAIVSPAPGLFLGVQASP